MSHKFKHGVVGGTFDRLHRGHKELLGHAFAQAAHVTIGVTLPQLYQNKLFSENIQSFSERKRALLFYLTEQNWSNKATILPIADLYGSTLTDTEFDCIIVSEETEKNAIHINEKRKKVGLRPLTIITIPLLMGEDNEPLRSENIRKGLSDAHGNSYLLLLEKKSQFILPSAARSQLQQPIGEVIQENAIKRYFKKEAFITTVGDITTLTLLAQQIFPAIAIIDGKTRRKTLDKKSFDSYFSLPSTSLLNPSGTINSQAAIVYKNALDEYLNHKATQVVLVEGEEDLLALPAILLAPLGSYVLYGQYEIGIIVVEITEKKKELAKNILQSFA